MVQAVSCPALAKNARAGHPRSERNSKTERVGHPPVDPGNPQSWNRYAYVTNNPLSTADPSGLDGCNGGGDLWSFDFGGGGGTYNGGFSYMPDGGCMSDSQAYQMFEQSILPGENSINFPMGTGNLFGDIWNALGLPSGLSCPQVGGVSNFLCGGVNSILDSNGGVVCDADGNCTMQVTVSARANNGTAHCAGSALKQTGVSLALDAASIGVGLIPGGQTTMGAVKLFSTIGVGAVSTAYSTATSSSVGAGAGQLANGTAGTLFSAIGILEKGAPEAIQMIPILGNLSTALSTGVDLWHTYQAFSACRSGG